MKPQTFLLSLIGAATVGAVPFAIKTRADDRGSYEVSGLGSRKQEILQAGGSTLDIAIAMLESDTMQTDYAYGQSTCNNMCEIAALELIVPGRRQQVRRRRQLRHLQAELGFASRVLEEIPGSER